MLLHLDVLSRNLSLIYLRYVTLLWVFPSPHLNFGCWIDQVSSQSSLTIPVNNCYQDDLSPSFSSNGNLALIDKITLRKQLNDPKPSLGKRQGEGAHTYTIQYIIQIGKPQRLPTQVTTKQGICLDNYSRSLILTSKSRCKSCRKTKATGSILSIHTIKSRLHHVNPPNGVYYQTQNEVFMSSASSNLIVTCRPFLTISFAIYHSRTKVVHYEK